MVCYRCISAIEDGIKSLGYNVTKVSLGKLSLQKELSKEDYQCIEKFLIENGFEMISTRQLRIINHAKNLIDQAFAETAKHNNKLKFSSVLSETLHMNYDSISQLFSQMEGVTLERYIITKRLEKVKELLVYTELTLTEIAFITGFSSINHLSSQFKELTGLSPSHFKAVKANKKKLMGS